MKIKSSPQLLAFYKWWLENKDTLQDLRSYGLCRTATWIYTMTICEYPGEYGYKLAVELSEQFKLADLDTYFPFGVGNYERCARKAEMHLDPLRIAWVEARIRDMED